MFIEAPTDTITVGPDWDRPSPDLLHLFDDVPAANIADVFDRLLVMDAAISPVTRAAHMVGSALPVLTRGGDNLAIHRALDDAQPGDVLVVSGQAETGRAVIGDLIGEIMRGKGVVGAVVDGAVRDAEVLDQQGLVVFARGLTPAGPFKSGPGVVGGPIACGGVVVSPGDIVVSDGDGVAIIPVDRAQWAAREVEGVIAREEALRLRIRAELGSGSA